MAANTEKNVASVKYEYTIGGINNIFFLEFYSKILDQERYKAKV